MSALLERLLRRARETQKEPDQPSHGESEDADASGVRWQSENVRDLAERVARDALRSRRRAAGAVDGRYWTTFKPAVSDLTRERRFDEARDLLEKCVEAAEREAEVTLRRPDSWPTRKLSTVLHRTHAYDQERTFLERYAARCMPRPVPDTIATRLDRSRSATTRD